MKLRIANWNLERIKPDTARAEKLLTATEAVEADIWILTETNRDFTPVPGYYSQHSGQPDRPSKEREAWCSIWARNELEDLNAYISDPARCTAARLQHPSIGGIIVYALILPWHTDNWQGKAQQGRRCLYRGPEALPERLETPDIRVPR
jgi:hypothetical protein